MMCVRCEELTERIRQLETQLYGWEWEPPRELGFTPCQRAIVQTLVAANGRVVSREVLIDATRRTPQAFKDYPELRMMDTVICKIRDRMRPHDLVVHTIRGQGFFIPPETRARLLNWNSEARAA